MFSHVTHYNDTATTEIYTLSLHDALPISSKLSSLKRFKDDAGEVRSGYECGAGIANFNDVKVGDILECFNVQKLSADRKSTRLNSSHSSISYAVFCLKKKRKH